MANGVFNIAKGRVIELHDRVKNNDPPTSGLVVVLLKTAEADGILQDYDTLAAILGGSNVEADFTNYSRKVLTDGDIAGSVVDDSGNVRTADIPDQTWTAAGGATNNTLAKLLICYDPDTAGGTDSAIIPMVHLDCLITTNGGNLTAQFNASGYFSAS